MGIVSDIVTRNSDDNEYAELTDKDLVSSVSNKNSMKFVDVKSQNDLVNAKEHLNKGSILILDISYIESCGMSLEMIYNEMKDAVESTNGDVLHKKRNDIIVATPRDISISREKL